MHTRYRGVIWTDHALARLRNRGIKQGDAWGTWKRPDKSRYAKSKGAWIYYRTWGNQRVEVAAKQNESREWVILSVWSTPVSKQKSKSSFIKRIFFKIFS